KLTGIVVGGWLMARSAQIAAGRLDGADAGFYKAKLATAAYFAKHVIPEANSYRDAIVNGSAEVLALEEALF
ncbi:MAG: acyl-CoA dehydrogenase C-terminal domain-containing protein, partial [Proteobacteria bacterium]|nr:acyl-CoA dehydrogenase C-terminal domain-containing protein [Pseudomonadota bacterium]